MKLHFMLLFILINNTSQHGGVPKNIKKVRWPWHFKKKYIYIYITISFRKKSSVKMKIKEIFKILRS